MKLSTQLTLTLALGAELVYGTFLARELVPSAGGEPSSGRAFYALAVILLPYAVFCLRLAAQRHGWVRLAQSPLLFVGEPLALLAYQTDLVRFVSAIVVLAQGHLFLAGWRNRGASLASLATAPLFVLLAMALGPRMGWVVLFAISVLIAVLGLLLLETRAGGLWLTRRASPKLAAAWSLERGEGRATPDHGRAGWRLTAYGALASLAILGAAPLFLLPGLLLPEPRLVAHGRDELSIEARLESIQREETQAPATRRERTERSFDGSFPGRFDFTGGVGDIELAEVLELRWNADAERPRQVYLRGMVLDRIDEHGVSSSRRERPALLDRPAGSAWLELGTGATAGTRSEHAFSISQTALAIGADNESVLVAPRPLSRVRLPSVRHDPDHMTLAPAVEGKRIEYDLQVAEIDSTNAHTAVDRETLGSSGSRWLQLPPGRERLDVLRDLARQITSSSKNDRERVQAVLDYFHTRFQYSLRATDFPGLVGVIDFLQRKSGHCTYYASSACLLLRSLGIPTRLATGFLASEWSAERNSWVVTTKNGHAWIEVLFEQVGWVRFDPTPAASRARVLGLASPGEDALARSAGAAWTELGRWFASGERYHLEAFARRAGELLGALIRKLDPRMAVALILTGGLIVALRRRARRSSPGPPTSTAQTVPGSAEHDLYARLLDLLARRGHTRRAWETPREFARATSERGGAELAPLIGWTERLYRARFGRQPWSNAELDGLRDFLRALEPASPPELES